MKKNVVLLLSILFFSQDLVSQIKKDSSGCKNEIGISLIPVVVVFSTYPPFYLQNKIQYKRYLKPQWYYRAGLGFEFGEHYYSNDFETIVTGQTDSSLYILIRKNDFGKETILLQGIEYRWGKKMLKQFCGSDLGFSYSEDKHQSWVGERKKGFWGNLRTMPLIGEDSTVSERYIFNNGINLVTFYGLQFHFSKHLFFSLQLGLRLKANFVRLKYFEDNKQGVARGTRITFGDETPLQDFSLFYRF